MISTEATRVQWTVQDGAVPDRISLTCGGETTDFFQVTVSSTLAASLASGPVDGAEVVAKWPHADDYTRYCGTITGLDSEHGVMFDDGTAVPVNVIVAVAI